MRAISYLALGLALCSFAVAPLNAQTTPPVPLVTGKFITPIGQHTEIGSFPVHSLLSPDGRYIVVTNTGFRQYLSVIRVADGKIASRIEFNALRRDAKGKEGLYYGLAFGPVQEGKYPLYASLGAEDRVDIFTLDANGILVDTRKSLHNPTANKDAKLPHHIAGIALNSDGSRLYAANNQTGAETKLRGSLSILDTVNDKPLAKVDLPGFPFAVAALTVGPHADKKVYVTSERDGVVSVVSPQQAKNLRNIRTGMQPIGLLLNQRQDRLYVANAGSDTISVINTETDKVIQTILVRPDDARGLPGATPTGMALGPGEKTLYVTLADMNCLAVVDTQAGKLIGYLPTGWYPTSVTVAPGGGALFVTSAKGINARNPNGKPVGAKGQYIQNIIEGTISRIETPKPADLINHTRQTIENNRLTATMERGTRAKFVNPGIEYVIYIIKENRTYDQVLGDLPQGNGDKSLCLFPREVTPNQHALAERFVLLDNFYVCAEVSADGWQWSVAGMASEYTSRNAPFNYSGRGRNYDFEGQNNGVPVDLLGLPDVARTPGGYIWDLCAKHGVSYRNYGCYVNFGVPLEAGVPTAKPGTARSAENIPVKKALQGHTDLNFRLYDMDYPDSELWKVYNAPQTAKMQSYGKFNASSRFAAWKREYDAFVKSGKMPRFMIVRFPRNHTSGTSEGAPTPKAMVADNDYAVGQLVEAVSHSPYWKKTAIFILEDDAQNGFDHVDAHRSIAFVISPYIKKGTIDSSFYNTDSMLRTMQLLLGLPPMSQYDAIAPPMTVFGRTPENDAPFTALLPDRRIATEVNLKTAYRARDSKRLLNPLREESAPDEELNDILWHAIKGRNTPKPPLRYGLRLNPKRDDD